MYTKICNIIVHIECRMLEIILSHQNHVICWRKCKGTRLPITSNSRRKHKLIPIRCDYILVRQQESLILREEA